MLSGALRLPDVHDFESTDDPGEPCPGCLGGVVEDGICDLCGVELCEECGKVEVTGVAAKCDKCAPLYTVATPDGDVYRTRSLRRAWEATNFWDARTGGFAVLVNYDRSDLGSDGITDREQNLFNSWDVWQGRKPAVFHLCLQQSDHG